MIKIEAITLEDAYSDAAKQLNCSVTELVVEVVQYPSSGVLGFFKKNAIIVATIDKKLKEQKEQLKKEQEAVIKAKEEPQEELKEEEISEVSNEIKEETSNTDLEEEIAEEVEINETMEVSQAIDEAVKEIEKDLNNLFKEICFELDEIKVSAYDENTVYVELNGEDAALLIGKEGYRYKALNFMLYNWINQKYGFKVRLEIAEFLKTQEEMLRNFLAPFIEKVKEKGYGKTKPFNGILAFLALEILREAFPDKYVALRERGEEKYVVIGDRNGDYSGNSDS